MTDEDKIRVFRKLKLSIYDLELIRGAIRDQSIFYFKAGIEDRHKYLKDLDKKIKLIIEKEYPI
jgi:hypothetical protein